MNMSFTRVKYSNTFSRLRLPKKELVLVYSQMCHIHVFVALINTLQTTYSAFNRKQTLSQQTLSPSHIP